MNWGARFSTPFAHRFGPVAAQITGRTLKVTIVQTIGAAMAMGAQVTVANLLGIEQFGYFAIALSCLLFGSGIGRAGLETVSVRYVAAYHGQSDWPHLAGVILFARKCALVASGVVSAVGACAALVLWDRFSPTFSMALLFASAGGFVFVQAQIVQAQLRGLHLPIAGQLPEPLLRSAGLAAIAGVLLIAVGPFPATADFEFAIAGTKLAFSLGPFSASLGMAANIAGMGFALVVALYLLRKALPAEVRSIVPQYESGSWLRVGWAALLINVAGLAVSQADIIAVGMFSGSSDAGAYAAATRLAALVVFVLSGANVVMGPVISQYFAQGRMDELQKSATFICRAMAVIAVPVAAGIALLAGPLLSLFGDEFQRATLALAILAIGQVLNAVTGPCALLLTMTKHHNVTAVTQIALLVGNIALLGLLVPRYGIEGAAWARVGMLVVENLLYVVLVRRLTGIRSTPF